MSSIVKPFEQELHDKYDANTKQIAVNFLQSTGCFELETELKNQPERYKAYDFYIRYKPTNTVLTIEVERKAVWIREGTWQYAPRGIHIPHRKAKSKADLFIVINKSGKTLMYTDMRAVLTSPIINKATYNRVTGTKTKNEGFFELSLTHADVGFYTHDGDKWRCM